MTRLSHVDISIVIPTRNRAQSLKRLLATLVKQTHPIQEVIIVDASDDKSHRDPILNSFATLPVTWIDSEASVCVQRNIGIRASNSAWIFLCDDDMEVPPEYLNELTSHIKKYPVLGAVSGLVLQNNNGVWTEQYPITSTIKLLWIYIFQLSIWGEIKCNQSMLGFLSKYYKQKGNHISKAGWPVLTNFSGEHFATRVYGLGASLIKREWLINSAYDELLGPNGIGDHYGVSLGFPDSIHVVKCAFVYHHQDPINRVSISKQYYHRALSLHYFLSTLKEFSVKNRIWFFWSLLGSLIFFMSTGRIIMFAAICKLFVISVLGNPLLKQENTELKFN